MIKRVILPVLLLAVVATGSAQMVSFKLTGGLTWINGDDYNAGIAGQNLLLADTSTSLSGAYESLARGPNIQFEITNYFNPHVGIGLGGGYAHFSADGTVAGRVLQSGLPTDFESTYRARVSAVPFFLNFHYLARLGSRLGLDLFAGPVFWVVQFHFENPLTLSLDTTQQTETFTASQTGLGGQAGLAVDINLASGLAFVVQGSYRFGRVTDLTGNWAILGASDLGPINLSGSDYSAWFYLLTSGSTYDQFGYFDAAGPVGADISQARHAEIDLSGATLSAGVKLSF
jgi:hypothetical protein